MAPSKTKTAPFSASVGNCEVTVESRSFSYESDSLGSLRISVSRKAEITISVRGDNGRRSDDRIGNRSGGSCNTKREEDKYFFSLLNPKDVNTSVSGRLLIEEVVQLYKKELPAMKYAANTGKESTFLERCVSSGKYCTLFLKSKSMDGLEKIIAAITYQILPVDTLYAEVPLAAVSSIYQKTGFGALLFRELRNRLGHVGIRTIFCWGDQESEGFWFKMGFVSVAEVDTKGRARRLPVRADIRKALCFPGGSTLMVSHISNHTAVYVTCSLNSCTKQCMMLSAPSFIDVQGHEREKCSTVDATATKENCRTQELTGDVLPGKAEMFRESSSNHNGSNDSLPSDRLHYQKDGGVDELRDDEDRCQYRVQNKKMRVWEASLSSLQTKKVKGGRVIDCHLNSDGNPPAEIDGRDSCFKGCSLGVSRNEFLAEAISNDRLTSCSQEKNTSNVISHVKCEDIHSKKPHSGGDRYKIMLMDIGDDSKKTYLTKVIEELSGVLVSDGSVSTHIVIAGKVRRTLNFCTGLCSGAWIVSPSWLKQSFREGRFVEEMPHVLDDRDYLLKYKSDVKDAILRGKVRPGALLKGFHVCIAAHVQPSRETLTAITIAAGGQVIRLSEVKNAAKTIFVACEEDMEEALVAIKKRLWTFSSDWFMNFIMRQELDLEAPQFIESL